MSAGACPGSKRAAPSTIPRYGVWALSELGETLTLDQLPEVLHRADTLAATPTGDEYNPHKSGQSFTVAIVNDADDTETVAPMKMWLRKHMPDAAIDVDAKHSRYIARWLLQQGWTKNETSTEYRLYPPGSTPIEVVDDDDDKPEVDPPAADCSFKMEAELRNFLAFNLATIKIADLPPLLLHGVEVSAGGGFIDILATDTEGAFYVFELKRAKTPDAVIGQIVRYMAWVTKNMANGKPVRGVIVAKEITEQLKNSRVIIPNISLFQYQVAFTLNPAA